MLNRNEFQFSFFPFVAPRLPKTESAAVIHYVVLMLHLARSHDKSLTTKSVVWNKYGITYSFPNPTKKRRGLSPCTRDFDLAAKEPHAAQIYHLIVSTLVIHAIYMDYYSFTDPKRYGRPSGPGWFTYIEDTLPTKWPLVNHRSDVDLGKSASRRPTF